MLTKCPIILYRLIKALQLAGDGRAKADISKEITINTNIIRIVSKTVKEEGIITVDGAITLKGIAVLE